MSRHFSANQYDNAFQSKKLQNWENPCNPRAKPNTLTGYTKVISDDKGHLLEGAPRSSKNPWGDFTGTWDLPTKISGNRATVPTGRSSLAQQKLAGDARTANDVICGKAKNEGRLENIHRHERDLMDNRRVILPNSPPGSASFGNRSGADAPATSMMVGANVSSGSEQNEFSHFSPEENKSPLMAENMSRSPNISGSVNFEDPSKWKESPMGSRIPSPKLLSPTSENMAPIYHSRSPNGANRAAPSPGVMSPVQRNYSPGQHDFNPGQGTYSPGQHNYSPGQHNYSSLSIGNMSPVHPGMTSPAVRFEMN